MVNVDGVPRVPWLEVDVKEADTAILPKHLLGAFRSPCTYGGHGGNTSDNFSSKIPFRKVDTDDQKYLGLDGLELFVIVRLPRSSSIRPGSDCRRSKVENGLLTHGVVMPSAIRLIAYVPDHEGLFGAQRYPK
jgi:hypothetical protein